VASQTFLGIFALGFVFGYLLYYAVRHTKDFNIDLFSSAIGTIGGGVVVGTLGQTLGWIGPYGLGIGTGFLFYLILSLFLISIGKFDQVDNNKVMLVSKTLIGTPKQE
jgi:hypothetical protein